MAYKFQVGPAQLSGSTVFEDAVSAASVTSVGASSAATLSASAGVSGGSFDSDGDATFGTITMPGFAVDADGDVALKSLAIDDGSTIGSDSDTDILTLNAQSAVLANDVDFNVAKVGGFQLAGAAVTSTAAELNYLDNDDLEAADFTKLAAVTATAAELNLVDAVARGSIIYGNSSGASALLAKGATHAFLQSDGTDISYVSMTGDATLVAGALSIGATKVTDAMMNDDVAAGLAGPGLSALSGAMGISTSGSLAVVSDKVGISGSIAGAGLAYEGGVSSISSLKIDALGVARSMLAADAVDGTKLADDSVDSEHIVDGSIDTAHIANAQVTEAKLATSVAGLGLSGGGGSALALDLNELTAETLASGDFLAFVDSTDNGTHKETIDDLAAFMAGPGLGALSGSVGVTTDGATLEVNSDTVRVKDAGITLAKMAVNSVDSDQYVDGSIDLIHMSANSVDSDQYVDGSIDLIHMSVNSVDSDQYVDGSIDTIHLADANVTEAKLAASVAGDGLSGGAGSALALDLNELTAAVVDVANDSFAIIDADGDGSKKESIADLVSAMAGAGLTATNGVLDANPTIASVSAAGTLSADVTFVTLGSAGDMTLPTAAEGKKLTVKRVGGAGIVSVVAGTDDLIGDGLVNLDTIGAAVTLVAQSDSTWWII